MKRQLAVNGIKQILKSVKILRNQIEGSLQGCSMSTIKTFDDIENDLEYLRFIFLFPHERKD